MDAQAHITEAESDLKQLRIRKVYIQLRVPKLRAEIKQMLEQKKGLDGSGQEKSRAIAEQKIYANQHLIAMRAELRQLEQEQRSVLDRLRSMPVKRGDAAS